MMDARMRHPPIAYVKTGPKIVIKSSRAPTCGFLLQRLDSLRKHCLRIYELVVMNYHVMNVDTTSMSELFICKRNVPFEK